MNSVFSLDEISDSDSFWLTAMNRSSSEWALERFLQELSGPETSHRPPFTNLLTASSVPSSSVGSQSSTTKPQDSEDGAVEIKKSDFQNQHHPNHHSHPPPLGGPSSVPVDSDHYRTFLKIQLDLACAAAACARVYTSLLLFLGLIIKF